MRNIDPIDRALLQLLKHNSRASVTELSGRLGVTRATVNSRMSSLFEDGIIQRFTVDTNDASEDDLIQALSLIELDLTKLERVQRALKRIPQLTSVYTTNGKWGLVVKSESTSLSSFDKLLNTLGEIEGVTSIETCLLLSRVS